MKKNTKESGYATIFVMMLMVALFILLGFALKNIYKVNEQNRKDKKKLISNVEKLNVASSFNIPEPKKK